MVNLRVKSIWGHKVQNKIRPLLRPAQGLLVGPPEDLRTPLAGQQAAYMCARTIQLARHTSRWTADLDMEIPHTGLASSWRFCFCQYEPFFDPVFGHFSSVTFDVRSTLIVESSWWEGAEGSSISAGGPSRLNKCSMTPCHCPPERRRASIHAGEKKL